MEVKPVTNELKFLFLFLMYIYILMFNNIGLT